MQRVRQVGKLFRRIDGDTLFPAGFTGNELAGRLADSELIGYKGNQVLIGFAVDRRGLDSQLQAVAMQSRPFILAGLGLNMEIQGQNPMFPAIPTQPIKLAS